VMQCARETSAHSGTARYIGRRPLYTKNWIQYVFNGVQAPLMLLRFVLRELVTEVQLPGHRIAGGKPSSTNVQLSWMTRLMLISLGQ
jgi:hypothetical protein